MSFAVTINFADPDPSIPFTNPTDLVTLLRLITTGVLNVDLQSYVTSIVAPGVDDQDKIWNRIDSSGRPRGFRIFYSGRWVLAPPSPGARIGLWSGDPTDVFDSTGLGLPGIGDVALDTYGWALANGNNGTADFSDRFVCMGHMNNLGSPGFNTGTGLWETVVGGSSVSGGGSKDTTLTADQIYRAAVPALQASHRTADSSPGGELWGDTNGSTDFDVIAADAGNTTPDPVPTLPPYAALALIAYIGYA